ncbi:MAG: Type IV pilus biogenesis protein PilM [uncultured Paraburkholderia sp.]|nr:MAG: Type IV pilus biogenesis protein PilM [uncultured Paraburkholderia sp.]CAH2800441.1 MAG: Type IV pilus biogenesis protein PilM [uncultured Paraburkholderia sp.]CAH2934556.1 MAG: Type IV pilus biogenesis protein PilM [uncultured Paraburkholderia sp.]CAH2936172.1 MAG: Type IV pilus biogenesis protein PilM [uncultured Paraburkholderia sp.]
MTIRSSWLQAVQAGMQRFAAGIDVSAQEVLLVVVSQRARAHCAMHLPICLMRARPPRCDARWRCPRPRR